MFDLYPDILVRLSPGGGEPDDRGDYPVAEPEEMEHGICRAIRNGSGQIVTLESGQEYRFNYVVYLPAGTAPLKWGTGVRVYARDTGERIAQGQVKDFVSGPLGCKMWI